MKKKTILWSSIIITIVIALVIGIWFINRTNNKNNSKEEITKPIDPVIDVIIKQNSSAKADNLEIQKEKEEGKYKVIDKKQSTKYHTVYYLVDPNTNEVKRFSKTTITIGKPE